MKLSTFMLLNVAMALLDFVVTYSIGDTTNFGPTVARSCGALTSLTALVVWSRYSSKPFRGELLYIVATVVTIIVNYGLFTLLYLRNTILNWHTLFAVSTMAALLLGAAGYRRALIRKTESR